MVLSSCSPSALVAMHTTRLDVKGLDVVYTDTGLLANAVLTAAVGALSGGNLLVRENAMLYMVARL